MQVGARDRCIEPDRVLALAFGSIARFSGQVPDDGVPVSRRRQEIT